MTDVHMIYLFCIQNIYFEKMSQNWLEIILKVVDDILTMILHCIDTQGYEMIIYGQNLGIGLYESLINEKSSEVVS